MNNDGKSMGTIAKETVEDMTTNAGNLVKDAGNAMSDAGDKIADSGTASSADSLIARAKSQASDFSATAADKTKGAVGTGITNSSEALASVSKMIGDSANEIEAKFGTQYADYARKAATSVEDFANKLSTKDADQLMTDTRDFVRKSPGVAIAGAAVVGFILARAFRSSGNRA